jgi:hypothetical protein
MPVETTPIKRVKSVTFENDDDKIINKLKIENSQLKTEINELLCDISMLENCNFQNETRNKDLNYELNVINSAFTDLELEIKRYKSLLSQLNKDIEKLNPTKDNVDFKSVIDKIENTTKYPSFFMEFTLQKYSGTHPLMKNIFIYQQDNYHNYYNTYDNYENNYIKSFNINGENISKVKILVNDTIIWSKNFDNVKHVNIKPFNLGVLPFKNAIIKIMIYSEYESIVNTVLRKLPNVIINNLHSRQVVYKYEDKLFCYKNYAPIYEISESDILANAILL